MLILPIRTESASHRTPTINYAIIGVNMLVFLVLGDMLLGRTLSGVRDEYMVFHSAQPAIYQFFTYQFVHADAWHLLGNMLFLWVFGNSVNSKMGDLPYLLFYLAGGVFAAWGYALVRDDVFQLVGASGAIAAVTTAYLALFPRSRVTVLIWFFFIHFVEVSAMVIIGLKIIVWDNVIAPSLSGGGQIATGAHLAGYIFGFVAALGMLLLRALPRDQFDILALWSRWNRRRVYASTVAQSPHASRGWVGARAGAFQEKPPTKAEREHLETIAALRGEVAEAIEQRDFARAFTLHGRLLGLDERQCLSERHQLDIAREYYGAGRFGEAATAMERFAKCYPRSSELGNIMLLLGIIYARDLRQYDDANKLLTRTLETVRDEKRRAQCLRWLTDVRAALGKPAPEV
ncbi:MAG: rhomboid family intramembrane serine protease [Phycisphaerae bacterium]